MKASLIFSTLFVSSLSWAGIDRGNGGDPLTFEFETARVQAVNRIKNIKPCSFSADVTPEIKDWILSHQTEIADDVLSSQHVWITDPQSTCAFTQLTSKANITLSFESCRPGIKETNDAGKILVHESTHHFGISDESFANQVADAIYSAGSRSSCPVPPSVDPFDSASCPGSHLNVAELKNMIGLPNVTETKVGDFQISTRTRTCYGPDFCSDWSDNDPEVLYSVTYAGGRRSETSRKGVITVRLHENTPEIRIMESTQNSGYYRLTSQIKTDSTMFISKDFTANFDTLWSGDAMIADTTTTGWVTNSCYRQVIKNQKATRDSLNNDIIKQFEVVILSQFSKP